MKKLVKILGLLLVAGALFVGCKQNVDIDADKIELSNGTWDITYTTSGTASEMGLTGTVEATSKEAIKVSGDTYTYLSSSYSVKFTVECGSADAAAAAKAELEAVFAAAGEEDMPSVSVSGSKLVLTSTETSDADDIAAMNEDENLVSEFTGDLPEGATLKRNKSKTEYKLTFVRKADPDDEDDADMNITVTIKKRK